MAEEITDKSLPKKKKRGGFFALGIVIICFALVGAVFLGGLAVGGIKSLGGKEKKKEEYEKARRILKKAAKAQQSKRN